jgi:dihydrofolate reductase
MRKLIAGAATSIDGYIEGPNGEIDWIIFDKEQFNELGKQWKKTAAMFYGRKTYEVAKATLRDSKEKQANPFAHMRHYVFSNTLKKADKGFTLISGDIKKTSRKNKKRKGATGSYFRRCRPALFIIEYGTC